MNAISSPVYLAFMLENKNSVLILEDCEMLLADRTTSRFADGINNILNMTDGLYSDILNIKIIATFNSDMTSIDKALLRDGRLISKYEFKELSIDKTNTLLKELGKGESDKPLTLAEIYNKTSEEIIQVKKPKRIGF
jgi:ATP-dependent 26S proteasome regulatory subunit